MNSIDILKDITRRPLEEARALHPQLTPELLNAHPRHDNSIAWLLWHSTREIDEQLAHLAEQEPVWTAQGFQDRFSLGREEHDMGFGHSGADARSIQVSDPDLLVEHLRAVVEAQLSYLDSLSDSDLEEVIDAQWDPPVTRAARLISISLDAVQHIAQAAYITGMGPAAFEQSEDEDPRQQVRQVPG